MSYADDLVKMKPRLMAIMKHLNLEFVEKRCKTCEGDGLIHGYGVEEECEDCHGSGWDVGVRNKKVEFETFDKHTIPGRNPIHEVIWPEGVDPEWVKGHEIILDGKVEFCTGIEAVSYTHLTLPTN